MGAVWLRLAVLRRGVRRYREVRALARLAGELRALELRVTVEETVLALLVWHELVHPLVCITIDPDMWIFTWRGGFHRHPANDPAGAARRIRTFINTRADAGWGVS